MTDGLTATIALTLKPEAAEAFCAGLPNMVKDTAAFPGCRNTRIVRHKDDPNRLLIVGQWDSLEAFNAYQAWRAETGAPALLGAILTAPPQIDIWPSVIAKA